jgi:hypothetical protein
VLCEISEILLTAVGIIGATLGVARLNIDGSNAVLACIGTTLETGRSKLGFPVEETELLKENFGLDAIASSYISI